MVLGNFSLGILSLLQKAEFEWRLDLRLRHALLPMDHSKGKEKSWCNVDLALAHLDRLLSLLELGLV